MPKASEFSGYTSLSELQSFLPHVPTHPLYGIQSAHLAPGVVSLTVDADLLETVDQTEETADLSLRLLRKLLLYLAAVGFDVPGELREQLQYAEDLN